MPPSLRSATIRLAALHPHLRAHLLPMLRTASDWTGGLEDADYERLYEKISEMSMAVVRAGLGGFESDSQEIEPDLDQNDSTKEGDQEVQGHDVSIEVSYPSSVHGTVSTTIDFADFERDVKAFLTKEGFKEQADLFTVEAWESTIIDQINDQASDINKITIDTSSKDAIDDALRERADVNVSTYSTDEEFFGSDVDWSIYADEEWDCDYDYDSTKLKGKEVVVSFRVKSDVNVWFD